MVLLRMSPALKREIQMYALDAYSNLTDTIVRAMAIEFGVALDRPEPKRGTPFGGGRRKY